MALPSTFAKRFAPTAFYSGFGSLSRNGSAVLPDGLDQFTPRNVVEKFFNAYGRNV
jgi:hypothetical protein